MAALELGSATCPRCGVAVRGFGSATAILAPHSCAISTIADARRARVARERTTLASKCDVYYRYLLL